MSKNKIKKELLEAVSNNTIIEFIIDNFRLNKEEELIKELTCLHNSKELDILFLLGDLVSGNDDQRGIYRIRQIYEGILPNLQASVLSVMTCTKMLAVKHESADSIRYSMPHKAFSSYCDASQQRTKESLKIVLASPKKWCPFLSYILISGIKQDCDFFFKTALDLTQHTDNDIRKNATIAIGQITTYIDTPHAQMAMDWLHSLCKRENSDSIISCIIESICALCIAFNELDEAGSNLLNDALSKSGQLSFSSAIHIFSFKTKDIPNNIFNILISYIENNEIENINDIKTLSYGISYLLKSDRFNIGIKILEQILVDDKNHYTLESFDHLIYFINEEGDNLRNKILSKWFANGDNALCSSISSIFDKIDRKKKINAKIEKSILPSVDDSLLVFIAKKAIVYLFIHPISCIDIIVSLMKITKSKDTINKLGRLLYNPILINYSGSAYDHLKSEHKNEKGNIKKAINDSIKTTDLYINGIREIPLLPEMQPSQKQREIKNRHQNRVMSESFREVQKDSFIEILATKSIILYGTTSVTHVIDATGKSHRSEIPMQKFEMSMETPRLSDLDPFGIDYLLRCFRAEKSPIK